MTTAPISTEVASSARDTVIVAPQYKADWDQYIRNAAGVIAWHSYEWCDLLRRYYGAEFYPIAVYDGPRICGILPLYRLRLFRKEILISVPYFVAGGIAAESTDVQQALLDRAIEISRELRISTITLKQYKLKLAGTLLTDENYYNRELIICADLNDVWNNVSELNRSKILESDQYPSELEFPSANVSLFHRFLLNDQHSAGVPCVSKRWIEELLQSGMYEVALLRHKGEVVAATMAKKFRDTVSFPFTSLREHDEKTELFAYSLYWKLVGQFAQQGIRIVHSGRIPKTDAAFKYRLGWGGTKYNYYYQYYGMGEGQTEFSTKRGRKRALIESAWKRIPTSVAGILGPVVVKQFP